MRRKLADNLKQVRDRIHAACERARRRVEDVRMIAVTKTVEVDVLRAATEIGLRDLGESRPQELARRAAMLQENLAGPLASQSANAPPGPQWHMIGHLQRNKVRLILPWVSMIHSVDSLRLAEEISSEAQRLGKIVPILIEVNVSGEKSKFGVAVGATSYLIEHINTLSGIRLAGLMTMAPLDENPENARPYFARLRELLDDLRAERLAGPDFRQLSMGMSNDFEIAIEEGATLIRLGHILFEGLTQELADASADEQPSA